MHKRITSTVVSIIILSFVIIANATVSLARVETLGSNTGDLESIKKLDKKAMAMLGDYYSMETDNKLPDNVKIDYEKAEKVYVDSRIFSLKDESTKEIEKELSRSDYIWYVNVIIDEETYSISFSKGMPLREEVKDVLTQDEINKIKAEEGKWTVSGIDHSLSEEESFSEIVDKTLKDIDYDISDAKVVICGGLEHIHYPVAIVMDTDEAKLLIPMEHMTVEGTPEQIKEARPEGTDAADVYLYSAIKEAVNEMKSEEDGKEALVGGMESKVVLSKKNTRSYVMILLIIGVFAVALGTVLVVGQIRKRKSRE